MKSTFSRTGLIQASLVAAGALASVGCGSDSSADSPACPGCSCTPAVGNVALTDGSIPKTGVAGLTSQMTASVRADTADKYNVFVKLTLVPVSGDGTEIPVAGVVVPYLAAGAEDEVTTTYRLPADLPEGEYKGILTLNEDDLYPEDDDLQGEATSDQADNRLELENTITIDAPTKPVLAVDFAELENNSVTIGLDGPTSMRDSATLLDSPDIRVAQEFVSAAFDVAEPVEVIFELEVPGPVGQEPTVYRLRYLDMGSGEATLRDTYSIEPTCRDVDGNTVSAETAGADCASLHAGSPRGRTFDLYLPDELYTALPTTETLCTLRVTLDPSHEVAVWNDDRDATVVELPVQYIPFDESAAMPMAKGPNYVFDKVYDQQWGNAKWNAGWHFDSSLAYWTADEAVHGIDVPVRGQFQAGAGLPVTVFGNKYDVIAAHLGIDLDIDNITGSNLDYGLDIVGSTIWADTVYMAGDNHAMDQRILLHTKDDDGSERYSKSKEIGFSFYYFPAKVEASIKGEIGLKGQVAAEANNILSAEIGPYAELGVEVKAGVGVKGFSVGVGGELTLLSASQKVKTVLQFIPSSAKARISVGFPLELRTLDGRLFVYYEVGPVGGDATIVAWDGLSYTINVIPPLTKLWGYADATGTVQIFDPLTHDGFAVGDNDSIMSLMKGAIETLDVYWVGDRFALSNPEDNTLFLRYDGGDLRFEELPAAGFTPEMLFLPKKGWIKVGSDYKEAWVVQTSSGGFWSSGWGMCDETCSIVDATGSTAKLQCDGSEGAGTYKSDDACCAGKMFEMAWDPSPTEGP